MGKRPSAPSSKRTQSAAAASGPAESGKVKNVAVFFDAPGFDDYPFDDPEFRLAYHQLGGMLAGSKAILGIVRGTDTYLGNGTFRRSWIFRDGNFEPTQEPWTCDVLFNKGRGMGFIPTDVVMVNEAAFEQLCTNKWETYLKFTDFFPETLLVHNEQELTWAMKQLPTEMIVSKPLDGEGGAGITIGRHDEIERSATAFPLLLQSFLDTGGGIPGLAEGMHDLRLISISGVVLRSYIRQPKEGSYLANFQQGGSLREIPIEAIHQDALTLFNEVDRTLRHFPHRVYSVDMGRDREGCWKLIELNSKPGLDPMVDRYPQAERFMRRLVRLLLSV